MPHRRLKIVHVFRAPLGGLYRHVLDLARAQIDLGHHVGIFCDSTTGGQRADETLNDLSPGLALGLRRYPMHRSPGLKDCNALMAFKHQCDLWQPDIIHGHGSKGGLYARLPAFFEGSSRPVRAYTPHGGSFNYKPGTFEHKLYMGVEGLLEKRTDVFLFESEFIADRFQAYVGQTDKTVRIVQNGISEEEFEPIVPNPDAYDLVYVGELRSAKGVDILIEALGRLKEMWDRSLSLLIVGSGPDEEALKRQAHERGVGDIIDFAPPQPIRKALAQGRVMVIPSKAESLPYVILEAAAAGQPLVATNVGGIPEIFGPYKDRLIPASDPENLVSAVATILGQLESERNAQAHALSQYVRQRFSLKSMIDGVIEGYRMALAKRGFPSQ